MAADWHIHNVDQLWSALHSASRNGVDDTIYMLSSASPCINRGMLRPLPRPTLTLSDPPPQAAGPGSMPPEMASATQISRGRRT